MNEPVQCALPTPIAGEGVSEAVHSPPVIKHNSEPQSTAAPIENPFDLAVKKEYLVQERPESLGPLPVPPAVEEQPDDPGQGGGGGRKKKRNKGQNKKRPRDSRPPDNEKLCMFIIQGEECPHTEGCRFSHDVETYLRTKPADLQGIEGGCPDYRLTGFCRYGVCCRLGGCHTTKEGKNVRNSETVASEPTKNVMDREVLSQLRKKQFPFSCQRRGTKEFTESSQSLISTPMPDRERKTIDFSGKIYVAPLTTVGNLPFRRIMKHFGTDITCGEMAVVQCLLEGKHSEWSLVKRHPCEDVFGIQLAAGHADQFTRISEVLEKHADMDFVDLNLGCPLDMICSKGGGAQLMLRDRKLKESLIGICNTLSVPVTVKMRTGWDSDKPIAHKLVKDIQKWGIKGLGAIMIHGRSRLQRYSKSADWDYIAKVYQSQSDDLPKIPIIGNGDIFSFTDYEEKVAREGIQATAMLGRGALIKPWLPTEIKERRHWDISATERMDILKDFVRFGLEHWGSDQQGVNTTRRFLLEWLSFLHRYVPVGLLEHVPQQLNQRSPNHMIGRNDLETLFMSSCAYDWIKISEMLLGPVPEGFDFEPKHKANSYRKS